MGQDRGMHVPKAMKAPSSQDTRCAIALNNIGCLLLERNCHRQAHATFQDALELMKNSTEATAGGDNANLTNLHSADLRLSNPQITSSNPPLETLSYSLTPASLEFAMGVASKDGYHPLRIDVIESEDETIKKESLSCILLLNFAISCRSIALTSSARDARSMDCVLRILTLVNMLVDQCDDNSSHSMLLLLLTLDTTKKALTEAGKHMEAEMLAFRLQMLRSYASSALSVFLVQQPSAGAA